VGGLSVNQRELFWRLISLIDMLSRDREMEAKELMKATSGNNLAWMIAMCEETVVWIQEDLSNRYTP
jgi:hypothetical protein